MVRAPGTFSVRLQLPSLPEKQLACMHYSYQHQLQELSHITTTLRHSKHEQDYGRVNLCAMPLVDFFFFSLYCTEAVQSVLSAIAKLSCSCAALYKYPSL